MSESGVNKKALKTTFAVVSKAKILLGQRMQYYKRFKEMSATEIGAESWQTVGNAY